MPGGPSRKMEWVSHDLACSRSYEDGDRPRGAASLRQQMLAWRSAFVEMSDFRVQLIGWEATTDAARSLDPAPRSPNAFARQFKTARDTGSLTGSERSRIASRKLKIAVFAPMPSARESTASAVNARLFSIARK